MPTPAFAIRRKQLKQESGMSNQADHLSLKLPPHDLEVLSFSAPNPKKIKEWVDSLPQLNVGESAKRLYAAIQ
ncbi:hypothetical protein RZS08_21920, partial [Arthrospira platensis SPKY1]|nr:hypothetical protein [Arthrospira platensis SPKY1]